MLAETAVAHDAEAAHSLLAPGPWETHDRSHQDAREDIDTDNTSYRRNGADKRRREIGAELFILYVRLNEAMLTADDIITSLESYTWRTHRHLCSGDDAYALTAGSWIAGKIDGLFHDRKVILQIIGYFHCWITSLAHLITY